MLDNIVFNTMTTDLFIFIGALYMIIKGATMATRYAAQLADSYHLSKYTVGFIVIAVISILPETFIAISSSLKGVSPFALGMLFGSNVADLTLIFGIIIFYAGRSLKVESKILKNHVAYPFLLILPLLLGADGYFSRPEGITLILAGVAFYYVSLKKGIDSVTIKSTDRNRNKNFFMLIFSMIIMLVGSHFTVVSASSLAVLLGVNPIIIGMLIVGLGTTMPELFFSLKAVKKHDDSLAIGDILGTVLADATIVVGILALINPFEFPKKIIYITGAFMVAAAYMLFHFMRSGRVLSKKEASIFFIFWILFVFVEFIVNQ